MSHIHPLIIIGAGPTGIGAAWRALELGIDDFLVIEATNRAGGLSASFTDQVGFTWDQGVHLQFSHFEKYDQFLDEMLPHSDWVYHQRRSAAWLHDRLVPYPVQLHLHHFPGNRQWECLHGLLNRCPLHSRPSNFREWIHKTFGEGLARQFLIPYNEKVWATPVSEISSTWVGDRIAVPDICDVLRRLCLREDDNSWGPNASFRYPLRGGTGRIWNTAFARIPECHRLLRTRVARIDVDTHQITTENRGQFRYKSLISTIPLDVLMDSIIAREALPPTGSLRFTETDIVNLGIHGDQPEEFKDRIWVYFSDPRICFYRMTLLSNLSPFMTPDTERTWSVTAEIGSSDWRARPPGDLSGLVERQLRSLGIIPREAEVISRWTRRLSRGFPVPTTDRDATLDELLPWLQGRRIYSRGRFGAWKYEVSNQDHSFMQGVEAVERVFNGHAEMTVSYPDLVNGRRNQFPYPEWSISSTLRRRNVDTVTTARSLPVR